MHIFSWSRESTIGNSEKYCGTCRSFSEISESYEGILMAKQPYLVPATSVFIAHKAIISSFSFGLTTLLRRLGQVFLLLLFCRGGNKTSSSLPEWLRW